MPRLGSPPARHVPRPEVVAWRLALLRDSGVGGALAERLAGDARCDVHAVLELVDRGCAPALAARITAPLDDEAPR
jgi:hypothetical protein